MNMLKIDEKLVKQYKPDGIVNYYYKSPSNMSRIVGFTDGTWMHIETDEGKGGFFMAMMKFTVMGNAYLDVFEKHMDKQGRVIRLYTVESIDQKAIDICNNIELKYAY